MHIALDAMGGDRGPEEMVSGAVMAVHGSDLEISLIGDQVRLESILATHGSLSSRIHVVHASQVVGMDESPFDAIRRKKDSSIMKAFALHKEGKVDAVVSAGNSGATLAAALKLLGRLEHVSRPGIAGIFPTLKGPVVMMDVGANVDCRPEHLFQFGVMATAFSQILFGLDRPRVGLLSIGEEGGKGNVLVKKSHELLQQSSMNYIGNVEGRDTFQGDVDVMVCDGFVGNVCLKLSEGLAEAVMGMLGEEISKSFKAKLGYLLAKDAFISFKKRVDYAEYGGAPLLGIRGNAIICHGRSSAVAIKNAIRVASEMARNKVNDRILELFSLDHLLVQQDEPLPDEAAAVGVTP
ncbi:MAG: phosphate acyltransferase PlsX [Deltaproteobacteria bacterium]|nr:phosphate acyltransferase PlsX [Deltaproteobacteria bacterium]